jgi:hypothetical protein
MMTTTVATMGVDTMENSDEEVWKNLDEKLIELAKKFQEEVKQGLHPDYERWLSDEEDEVYNYLFKGTKLMNCLDVIIALADKMRQGSLPEIKASSPEHKDILEALDLVIEELKNPTYPGYDHCDRTPYYITG